MFENDIETRAHSSKITLFPLSTSFFGSIDSKKKIIFSCIDTFEKWRGNPGVGEKAPGDFKLINFQKQLSGIKRSTIFQITHKNRQKYGKIPQKSD